MPPLDLASQYIYALKPGNLLPKYREQAREKKSEEKKKVHRASIAIQRAIAMLLFAENFGFSVPSIVKLLKYEWLDNKVKDGLKSLQFDLERMHAFLGDVTSLAPDLQLSEQVKLQADEIRDLSHSIGTCLHSFMVRIESSKYALILGESKLIINDEINIYINTTQIKVDELLEKHGPYPPKSSLQRSCKQKLDPRIHAKYKRSSNPVGIGGAIADLSNMMSKDNHAIISIVGMAGIGKTTLAQAVYDKMKGDFDCGAFVSVGQKADPEKILKDIFDGLHMEIIGRVPELFQIASQLQKLLVHKRCLIVMDDIWDKETLILIEYVCEDSAGSKVIITTRNQKFAKAFGGIYEIKPLCTDDSRKLLRTKAKVKSNDSEFVVLSDKILRKCAGVPMAITVIGSFLAKKERSEWNREYDSLGFDEQKEDSAFDVITKMMRYSYIDLPYRIQNCFLYLSLFPKDHLIEKNMLIWRWVAEGLVPDKLFETGVSYLNQLVDMNLLQWVVSPIDVGQGGCRVHGWMVDLIRDLSSSQEQNFSTVLDMKKQESTSRTRPIHRLAIHESSLGQNLNNKSLNVGEVKSFYAGKCTSSTFPSLLSFVELRVIDLEACDLSIKDCKLEHLGQLKYLEYIGLTGTPVAELPKSIGHLEFLQTLDVTATGIKELPPFVEKLRNLRCLRAGKGTRMMGRIGELTSLEELWLYSADKSPDFTVGLQKLRMMRVLVIHFDAIHDSIQWELVDSLNELKKLQVLQVWCDAAEGKVHLDCWEGSVPSRELRQLLLSGVILPRLIAWIDPFYVTKLSKLQLQVVVLKVQDLENLGQMPSLQYLYLYLHNRDERLSYTTGREEFQVLEYLSMNIELVCGDGALPVTRELEVVGIRVGMDVGLRGNMPLLERASYHLDCKGCGAVEVLKAEDSLKQASDAHPNRPALFIHRFNNFTSEVPHQIAPEILRADASPSGTKDYPSKLDNGEISTTLLERSIPLWSSLEMADQAIEFIALEGVLINANANPVQLSYQFIRSITNNFSQEIGCGGFAVVYLGNLGIRKVAVKKLSISQGFDDKLFLDEIKCLMRTKHNNNVVKFLGYCSENHGEFLSFEGSDVMADVQQRLLCFEYVPNGNLEKYLRDKSHKNEWPIRYQMIRGICHGLNYLHSQRISHLDLKPANILLDARMEPKITDFGISRCFDDGISRIHTETVRGTRGCIAPETIRSGEITFKSDIYGLGIIIIKLLAGRNKYDFESWHTSLDVHGQQVNSCIEIAQTCVADDQHARPKIGEIIQKLNEIERL